MRHLCEKKWVRRLLRPPHPARPKTLSMSPTRYSDPVTSTCTRRPLPSARSSRARRLTLSTAWRRHGTTAEAAKELSDDDEEVGTPVGTPVGTYRCGANILGSGGC